MYMKYKKNILYLIYENSSIWYIDITLIYEEILFRHQSIQNHVGEIWLVKENGEILLLNHLL
jgi:hypothetical protein